MMYLIDVNLALALAFQSHAHHPAAKLWFDGLTDGQVCYFCRMTQQGFLRLATNPKVFGSEAVKMATARELYDLFLSDPRVVFTGEPVGIELLWRDYTRGQTFSPKVWNDAYLVAFAHVANFKLVTFDRGFVQFGSTDVTILS